MLLAPLLVVSSLAAACGDPQTVESGTLSGSDAFTVSGDVGSAPEVEWKGRMKAGEKPETDVVTTGDGAELAADETVLVNYWVGNGYTRSTALDTYTTVDLPAAFPVGGQPPQPASQEPSEAEIARYLLDAFVADALRITRSRVVRATKASCVLVDGVAKKASYKVKPGEVVVFREPTLPPIKVCPEAIDLDILFEDEHLLVVNKPAGMAVHPAGGLVTGTLVNALLHHFGNEAIEVQADALPEAGGGAGAGAGGGALLLPAL